MASELEALVRSVEAADHSDESEWLEWKSQLDLSAKAGQFAVARAVIGMANRDPQIAGRFAEGHGYVIVGAEPGNLAGIPAIESHVLESRLAPYVGTDGPRWTSQNVSVDGTNVLVVTVPPRRNGDRFYWLERSYHSPNGKGTASSGTVFVRRKSSTERANSSEMHGLVQRMRTTGNPPLNVKIAVAPESQVPVIMWSEDDVNKWLRLRESRLLNSLESYEGQQESPPPNPLLPDEVQRRLMAAASSLQLDKRTPDDYLREVTEHIKACRTRLKPAALASYSRQKLGEVDFRLTNPTDIGFREVIVEITIHGAVYISKIYADNQGRLPKTPKPLGEGSQLTDMVPYSTAVVGPEFFTTSYDTKFHAEDSGSVTAEYGPHDLRAGASLVLKGLRVYADSQAESGVIHGEWSATAMGADGRISGRIEIALGKEIGVFDLLHP